MGFRELVFLQSFCLFICFWILTEFPSSTLHHPKDFRYHTAADNSETTCFDLCLIPRSSAPDRSVLYVTCLIPACLCIQHKKKKKKNCCLFSYCSQEIYGWGLAYWDLCGCSHNMVLCYFQLFLAEALLLPLATTACY